MDIWSYATEAAAAARMSETERVLRQEFPDSGRRGTGRRSAAAGGSRSFASFGTEEDTVMTRCSCTADRCSDHGEHAPCSVCRASETAAKQPCRHHAAHHYCTRCAPAGWTPETPIRLFVERHQ